MNSHRIIPPRLKHSFEDWASIVVLLCYPNTSKDAVVLLFVIDNIQVALDQGSGDPFFKADACLKATVSNALGVDKI